MIGTQAWRVPGNCETDGCIGYHRTIQVQLERDNSEATGAEEVSTVAIDSDEGRQRWG